LGRSNKEFVGLENLSPRQNFGQNQQAESQFLFILTGNANFSSQNPDRGTRVIGDMLIP